ncbi:PQ-loop repeat-containing protein [Stenotrophomonas sp. VV52]|uniref:PQ-loop repeat-containing protein n=1 Tax=Stenotrophomonas sp. VV52 TaxID=2066958 RepID=UPI000C9E15D3|nr:PQ-loop repeat-containing protein [Stenotrophomonas sp. VV52]
MEQPADLLGWAATGVLIATLARQIYKQHREASAEGVSTWLFVGQMTASILFIIYSALLGSTVFVVTNSLILLTAIVGQILAIRRRREQSNSSGPA